jgi:hypothetical protein
LPTGLRALGLNPVNIELYGSTVLYIALHYQLGVKTTRPTVLADLHNLNRIAHNASTHTFASSLNFGTQRCGLPGDLHGAEKRVRKRRSLLGIKGKVPTNKKTQHNEP